MKTRWSEKLNNEKIRQQETVSEKERQEVRIVRPHIIQS
jgi:hypothetical protein